MSTTTRWVLAVAAAAGVAVLTGATVGLLAGPPGADVRPAAAGAAPAAATAATSPGGGLAEAGGAPATARPTPVTPAAAVSTPAAAGAPAGARAGRGFAAGAALTGAAGVLLAALAVAALLAPAGRRRPHRPVSAAATTPAPGADPARAGAPGGEAPAPGQRAAADRAALVQACIYVRDRTTSRALADRLGAALQQAGVATVEPAGEAFDPARHEAGGTLPSRDPAQVGTIAAVEVPGYVDRGQPLRAPVVTVYQPAGGVHRTREDR